MEDYKRKLLLLTESYKQQKSNIDILTEEKEHLKIINRAKEEELSQITYNYDNLKKRFEALQSELIQVKEKKKQGMLDWVLTSSVKDENILLKEKINLLESELDLKIKENENLHSLIFETKYEMENKINSLDIKLTQALNDYDNAKTLKLTIEENLRSKENENVVLSCTLTKLKSTFKETKEDFEKSIDKLVSNERRLESLIKLNNNTFNAICPFSEYSSINYNNYYDKKSLSTVYYNSMINNAYLTNNQNNLEIIITLLNNVESIMSKLSECIDLFDKLYIVLKDISTDNNDTLDLVYSFKKISYYLNTLSFMINSSVAYINQIKLSVNELINNLFTLNENNEFNIDIIKQKNKCVKNTKNKINLFVNLFISSIIKAIKFFSLLCKLFNYKGMIELKISSELEVFEKIKMTNNILNSTLQKSSKLLSNILISLKDFQEVYVTFDVNSLIKGSSGINMQIVGKNGVLVFDKNNKNFDVSEKFNDFNIIKSTLNNIKLNLECIEFTKIFEIMLLNQLNIGIYINSFENANKCNNEQEFNNESKIFKNFNNSLYEEILKNGRDYYIKNIKKELDNKTDLRKSDSLDISGSNTLLIDLKTTNYEFIDNILNSVFKFKDLINSCELKYCLLEIYSKYYYKPQGIEYEKGIMLKEKEELSGKDLYNYKNIINNLNQTIDIYKDKLYKKELKINELEKNNEENVINNNNNLTLIKNDLSSDLLNENTFDKTSIFDNNYLNSKINLFNLTDTNILDINKDIDTYKISNTDVDNFRRINLALEQFLYKIHYSGKQFNYNNLNNKQNSNLTEKLDVDEKVKELELKLNESNNKYNGLNETIEGYKSNVILFIILIFIL